LARLSGDEHPKREKMPRFRRRPDDHHPKLIVRHGPSTFSSWRQELSRARLLFQSVSPDTGVAAAILAAAILAPARCGLRNMVEFIAAAARQVAISARSR